MQPARHPPPPRAAAQARARSALSRMAKVCLSMVALGLVVALVLYSVWARVRAELPSDEVDPAHAASTRGRVDAFEPLDLGWLGGTVHELRYHYEVAGQTYPGVSYPDGALPPCRAGELVPVRYDTRRPHVSVALGMRVAPVLASWRIYVLIGLAPAVGLLAFGVAFGLRARERGLIRRGQEARGRVVSYRPSVLMESRGRPYHWLDFAFCDGRGEEQRRRRMVPAPGTGAAWREGDRVTVFYDPRRPRRAIAYEPLLGTEPGREPARDPTSAVPGAGLPAGTVPAPGAET